MSRRLRAALLAYPRAERRRDGAMLLDLAAEMVDEGASTVRREAVALVRGGAAMRLRPVRHTGWHRALRHAATVVVVAYAGAVGAMAAGAAPYWEGWPGFAWLALLLATAASVAGLATRRWVLLLAATTVLVGLGAATSNGRLFSLITWFDLDVSFDALGFGYSLPMLGWAIPPLLLCALAAITADPEDGRARDGALVGWVLVVAVAAWALPTVGAAIGVPIGRLDAAGVVCGALLLGVLVCGMALGQRDPSWWLALALLLASVAPLPLIVFVDVAGGTGPALAGGVVIVVLAALAAAARRTTRATG